MKLLYKNPYQNVIDFIAVAVDSAELKKWLIDLEKLPSISRNNHLAGMKRRMENNREPESMIGLVRSLSNIEILSAVNRVIQDVDHSGKRTKRYLKKFNNENFNVLISLLAST